jgi:hypothetical protein
MRVQEPQPQMELEEEAEDDFATPGVAMDYWM